MKHNLALLTGPLLLATLILTSTTTHAVVVLDWSDVSLTGAHPAFSFSHPTLGSVDLIYDTNVPDPPIGAVFAGNDTLILGALGGTDVSLLMSWSNPIINVDIPIWDIDAFSAQIEELSFTTVALVSAEVLHSSDIWNGSVLASDSTNNPQSDPTNFSIMRFSNPSGFDSIQFNFSVSASVSSGFGIGDLSITVPEPSRALLSIIALGTVMLRRRR